MNPSDNSLVVYHDGSCPLCEREIAFFRRRVDRTAVLFEDVSLWTAGQGHDGLTAESAMARFHVRDTDGRLLSGARAFAALWRVTPGLRVAGRIGSFGPIAAVLEVAYRTFLRFRPALQRLAGAKACDATAGSCNRTTP